MCIFFDRMRRFLLNLDAINILCLVYSYLCTKTIIFGVPKYTFRNFKQCFFVFSGSNKIEQKTEKGKNNEKRKTSRSEI